MFILFADCLMIFPGCCIVGYLYPYCKLMKTQLDDGGPFTVAGYLVEDLENVRTFIEKNTKRHVFWYGIRKDLTAVVFRNILHNDQPVSFIIKSSVTIW